MGYARVQVSLNRDTNLPADAAVNVWHFRTPGTVAASDEDLRDLIEAFYVDVQGLLASGLVGTAGVKIYDLEDAPPRAPVFEGSLSFTPASTQLPGEVAMVMSFQGPVVSGTPQARRRGRLFLGPLSQDTFSGATGDLRPGSTARLTIATAAESLIADSAAPGLIWSAFSPTTAGPEPWSSGELDNAFVTVTDGWIDDAFDTIRSRGVAPSTRTLFTA